MRDRVIKPGTWWTVQVRIATDWRYVARVLVCANKRRAGNRGSERKFQRRFPHGGWCFKDDLKFVARRWKLDRPSSNALFRPAYKFDDLKDARTSSKCAAIKKYGDGHQLIVEIVERQGCLHYGTVVSERVCERRFPKDMNPMEVLALEHALGDSAAMHIATLPVSKRRLREG